MKRTVDADWLTALIHTSIARHSSRSKMIEKSKEVALSTRSVATDCFIR